MNSTGPANYLSGRKEPIKPSKKLRAPLHHKSTRLSRLYALTTIANDIACEAILMEETEYGQQKMITVASYTLSPTDCFTTEHEVFPIT